MQVLSDICLEVPRGSLHMLVGPNGCGKSTLLKILGGLMRADRGMCHVLPPAGFVFQNPDHQVVMPTVGADVAFGLGRYCHPTLDHTNHKLWQKHQCKWYFLGCRATHVLPGTPVDHIIRTSTLWMPKSPGQDRFGLLVLLSQKNIGSHA